MRKIVVLTSGLIRFEADGDRYTTSLSSAGNMSADILGGNKVVASFPDVHAVWFDDSVKLVPPEDL